MTQARPIGIEPPAAAALSGFMKRQSDRAEFYLKASRWSVGEIRPDLAETYARMALEDEFPGGRDAGTVVEDAFVAAVVEGGTAFPLALAVGALLAMRSADWTTAEELAERLIAADQHDLFAQRLLLAAKEKSADLSLAADDWLSDRFCSNPFEEIEIRANGAVHTCCSAWMPTAIGTIRKGEFWNSDRAAEIRRSVFDGDFSYCSRLNCPKIVNRTLPRREDPLAPHLAGCAAARRTRLDYQPQRVLLSQDRSCNLSCPSCRTGLIQLGSQETDELDRLFDVTIQPLLAEAAQIKVTGSGDPFGSRHFRHVLKRLTGTPATMRRIQIQTNAVLFDERAWSDLGLEGHIDTVWVSVDAARAETYRIVRRLGSFERLCKNLLFLGRLRAEGRMSQLRLDFVVQAQNFREMGEFVDLAGKIGADGVHFLMLRNWGTFSVQDYRDRNVGSSRHPDHAAFLAALRDPRLAHPMVDLGNVRAVFDESRAAGVGGEDDSAALWEETLRPSSAGVEQAQAAAAPS